MHLHLLQLDSEPVISNAHPDAAGNRFGFEGGTAFKVGSRYHLFTTEVYAEPKTTASRLVLWTSDNGARFARHSVLAETQGDPWDANHGGNPWSPMAVFDDERHRWSVFYVHYNRKPGAADPWNMTGRIARLDSLTPGRDGIAGPYAPAGFIDFPGPRDAWEGPAREVSFFPYRGAAPGWLAFYGSNSAPDYIDPLSKPQENNAARILFHVGLAHAPRLDTAWSRVSERNPVLMDPEFIENPVVTRLRPDLFCAVYDGGNTHAISYAFSHDGLAWQPERLLELPDAPRWLHAMRTPLGLIDEGSGEYTLYFTAFDGVNPARVPPLWHDGFGHVGRCRVALRA